MNNNTNFPQGCSPGIYFNMPEDVYHADPALSCSGIKTLLSDYEQFWYENPHLNKDAQKKETTSALEYGTMAHTKLLTPELFDELYVKGFDPLDYPDAIICNTLDELKSAMEEKGIEFKKSSSGTALIELVNERCPGEIIYSKDKSLVDTSSNKTVVKADDWERVQYAINKINSHPKISDVFKNGYPEVSIFWIDKETGVPCKSRIDYLKESVLVDYKTISLPRGAVLDNVCRNRIRFEHYDLQAFMYSEGIKEVSKLIESSWDYDKKQWNAVHGDVKNEFIEGLLKSHPIFGFIFQRSEKPCSIRGLYIPKGNDSTCAWGQGKDQFEVGVSTYKRLWEKFGTSPWVDDRGMIKIEDHEIYYP